jgi:hypothetical protein
LQGRLCEFASRLNLSLNDDPRKYVLLALASSREWGDLPPPKALSKKRRDKNKEHRDMNKSQKVPSEIAGSAHTHDIFSKAGIDIAPIVSAEESRRQASIDCWVEAEEIALKPLGMPCGIVLSLAKPGRLAVRNLTDNVVAVLG